MAAKKSAGSKTSSSKKKNNSINKQNTYLSDDSNKSILQWLTGIYVFALLVIFPLYMEKKYLNMGDAKYHFFLGASTLMLGLLLGFYVQGTLAKNLSKTQGEERWLNNLSVTDWFVLSFGGVSVLSCLFAHNYQYAVWGFPGWNMGLVSQIIFVLIYFFVSRFYKWSTKTMECAIVVGGIVFFIAVLQRFDLDIFGLYMNKNSDGIYVKLDDKYVEKFVSTLGQTSWYSSYAMLILPFGMYWYMAAKKLSSRLLTGVFVALGAASLCTVNSDSAYIAIALIMLVFFYNAFKENELMARFLEIVIIFLSTFKLIGFLQEMFPDRMITLISGDEKLTQFVNHSSIMLVILLLVIGIYIGLRMIMRKDGTDMYSVSELSILGEVASWIFIVAVWAIVLLMILVTKGRLPESLNRLNNIGFLNFDLNWGNYRGFNWRMAVRAFGEAGAKDKLIGVGPDSFAWSMNTYFKDEVATFWHGLQLACAHNEWLNMLVTEGVIGFIAYLGIFVTSAYRLGKNVFKNAVSIPCLAAVLAYVGYNFFCYQTCLCTPFIFMIMGIGEMIIRQEKNNN